MSIPDGLKTKMTVRKRICERVEPALCVGVAGSAAIQFALGYAQCKEYSIVGSARL
jgi:hypothetical protein